MNLQDIEQIIDNGDEIDMSSEDFGIIIGPDGKLKLLVLPDDIDSIDEVPDVIADIIDMFDHSNIHFENKLIH